VSEQPHKKGFDYFLAKETIEEYRRTPSELRLQWLYMGNQLRMGYDQKIIEKEDRLREGRN
jgi:hypothetical protein